MSNSILSTSRAYGTQQANSTSFNSQDTTSTEDNSPSGFAASFMSALDSESATTAQSAVSASDPGPEGSTLTWTATAPGVSTATGADDTKWTYTDLDQALTADDKNITGWSSETPSFNQAAELVAEDRADGTLTGPITKDYLLGNADKQIVGLIQRGPGISRQAMNEMVSRLSA